MTTVSANLFDRATKDNLTIKEAVELLKTEAKVRTLRSKLEYFAGVENLRSLLVDGLMENHPEAKKESVERRVRGWLNNEERSISKKDAIELCFVMKLDFEKADAFVTMVSEEGFHWRDPEEIVYIYALNNMLKYSEAECLKEKIRGYISNAKEQTDIPEESFTPVIRDELKSIQDEAELIEYIQDAVHRLGKYHNTAYKLFMEYLDLLQNPAGNEDMPQEQTMSTRDVVKEYFKQDFIPRFKQGGKNETIEKRAMLSAMERNVLANWPDEVTLSKIKNREADVTRKALILSFLATDGGEGKYGDNSIDVYGEDGIEEYYEMTREDIFNEMYRRINMMLTDCGFNKLDSRVPFDWMIMYCMCVDEVYEIDEKMNEFLEELFV